MRASGAGLIEWAPKVQAGDSVPIDWDDGTVVALPCTILLTQAINHATEHRSQIMAILTHLGIQPPDLDAWSYFEAQRKIASIRRWRCVSALGIVRYVARLRQNCDTHQAVG